MLEPRPSGSTTRGASDLAIRAELARILASDVFTRSARLTAFLRFIVDRTLAGEGEALKEQVIAAELYGKGVDFDAAADPIVRVDARRLRDRLREYYDTAAPAGVRISVPKGSYTPTFHVVALPAPPARVFPSPGSRWRWPVVVALAMAAASATMLGVRRFSTIATAGPRVLTVTAWPGSEGGPPVVSPDGNYVAFGWTGSDFAQNNDLWIKEVDGDVTRRLTDTPDFNEVFPAWSPDGRQIVFARRASMASDGIFLVSALGGPERRLTTWGGGASWSPDGTSLVIAGGVPPAALVRYTLATGEQRPLTTAPDGFIDRDPQVSPDGTLVAFVRSTRGQWFGGTSQAAVFVVPLDGGAVTQLVGWARLVSRPAWTPDSRELIFPRYESGDLVPYRVSRSGGQAVRAAGISAAYSVSISGARRDGTFRVALTDARSDVGMRMIDLTSRVTEGRLPVWQAFCDSTRLDYPGSFSRDGEHVAFSSTRGGAPQLYVARHDGSGMRRVTTFDGVSIGQPSWSPDGAALVFDGVDAGGRSDLFIASIAGGPLERLTNDAATERNAEWSRDGRWIYFDSDRTGQVQIWRLPRTGGPAVRLTDTAGQDPREGADGHVYYQSAMPNPWQATTLLAVPAGGGPAREVLAGVSRGNWDVTDAGIVFVANASLPPDSGRPDSLDLFRFADRQTVRLGELPFALMGRGYSPPRVLAASPDGRRAVVSHMDTWTRDILVVDNYR